MKNTTAFQNANIVCQNPHSPHRLKLVPTTILFLLTLFLGNKLSAQVIDIYNNQVWSINTVANQINIKPGGSLTINNGAVITLTTIYNNTPHGSGEINVEAAAPNQNIAGGRLIIDNATITGTSPESWRGIFVWGSRSTDAIPQTSYSQLDARIGKANIKNAIITNAETAGIQNSKNTTDKPNDRAAGGVLQVFNTRFIDNFVSVSMLPYQNYFNLSGPTLNLPDYSNFSKCVFEYNITGMVPNSYNDFFKRLVYLWGINGVRFLGNTYTINRQSLPIVNNSLQAIYGSNAGFVVDEFCNQSVIVLGQPCTNTTPSVFNFPQSSYAGVVVSNSTGYKPVQVNNATFNNTAAGINLSSANGSRILANKINLATTDATGIFMGGCAGQQVEGNAITTTGTGTHTNTFGIVFKECGAGAGNIFRNTVSNTEYALQGVDDNVDANQPTVGLRFLCNTMSNTNPNAYDITVVKSPFNTAPIIKGVSIFQANFPNGQFAIANNTFSALNSSTGPRNFVNGGSPLIYVGYIPPNGYTNNVNLISGPNYNCNPTYGSPYQFNPSAFAMRKGQLETEINADNDIEANLEEYTAIHKDAIYYYSGAWSDSAYTRNDSMIWVLNNAQYLPDFKIQKAAIEAETGAWTDAQTTLAGIGSQFSLTSDEQQDINNLSFIYHVEETFIANGQSWNALSASDRQDITDLANNGMGKARFASRYLLSVGTGAYFPPEGVAISNGSFERSEGGNIKNSARLASNKTEVPFQVFPNPVQQGKVKIVGSSLEGSSYAVSDALGRVLLNGKISESEAILDLNALSAGIYVLKVVDASGEMHIVKLAKN